jgi:hypothetical protein
MPAKEIFATKIPDCGGVAMPRPQKSRTFFLGKDLRQIDRQLAGTAGAERASMLTGWANLV